MPYLPDALPDTQGEQQDPEAGDQSSEQHLPDPERPDQQTDSFPASPSGLEPSISQEETVSADEEAVRESERAEEDLKAQQNMAAAAWAMVVVAFVQTGVTAVGVWLIWNTLKATQGILKEAETTTQAAARAADEAARANDETRAAFIEQRRAWIKITSFKFRTADRTALQNGSLMLEIEYENVGVTPALAIACEAQTQNGVTSLKEAGALYQRHAMSAKKQHRHLGGALYPGDSGTEIIDLHITDELYTSGRVLLTICLTYSLFARRELRQTGFAYDLPFPANEGWLGGFPGDELRPQGSYGVSFFVD